MDLVQESTRAKEKEKPANENFNTKSDNTDSIILKAEVKSSVDDGTIRRIPLNGNFVTDCRNHQKKNDVIERNINAHSNKHGQTRRFS